MNTKAINKKIKRILNKLYGFSDEEKRLIVLKSALLSVLINKGFIDESIFEEEISLNNILSKLSNTPYYFNDLPSSITFDKYKETVEEIGMIDENQLACAVGFSFSKEDLRSNGITYTPFSIRKYMLSLYTFDKNTKVLDPSSGSGLFLLDIYDILKSFYKDCFTYEDHKYILDNNLYATESDPLSALFCKILLGLKYEKFYLSKNIYNVDFLFSEKLDFLSFDLIVMNPPYIGNKQIKSSYRKKISEKFYTYYEKGDLSYCFIEKGAYLLKENGKFLIITKRYFLESLYADRLRSLIVKNLNINFIYDFYGKRPFENVGIDPVILLFENSSNLKKTKVIKGEKEFEINKQILKDGPWILLEDEDKYLFDKVNKKSAISLSDIVTSFQGIITGLDKAFVVEEENKEIIKECGVKWIKGSSIKDGKIDFNGKYLLYTNDKNEENIKNTIEYLSKYKDRLQNRRECKTGIRRWFDIQWARKKELFEDKKIIFRYKSNTNNFILDDYGYYFSADVYSLKIKDNVNISYDKLCMILNSGVYDFYYKCFAKKLGEDLYEYYPNTLNKIRLPDIKRINEFECEEDIKRYFNFKK